MTRQTTGRSNTDRLLAVRGSILHCLQEPATGTDTGAVEYFEDGLLIVTNGRVDRLGPSTALMPQLPPEVEIKDYSGKLITPGFIDTHIHYPQTDIIASYGEQLLEWLQNYTFPAESRFHDPDVAREGAEFFSR